MDQQTEYQMANMQEAIKRLAEQQQRMAQDAHQRQQQAAAEKMTETLVKIISSSYDKAIAYNNVVIIAGYATFFAIWGATKPALTHWISIASALLMVLSATVFVLFELFKMVQSSRTLMQLQAIAVDENARKDPEVFQSKMNTFETLQRSASLRFVRVWVAVLVITVSTAVAAIALLLYNYVCTLLGGASLA
jgi:hypothetical protein